MLESRELVPFWKIERFTVTGDDCFQVTDETAIERGCRITPFGRGNGLRQQAFWAALHSCRTYNDHGTGIGLDYHFRARANMSQKGGKVTRRFGFGDMDYSDLG